MNAPHTAGTDTGSIQPRRMAFDITLLRDKYFFRGNPILSTLLYSLSASFPDGERFFIDSVRHYQKDIDDPVLAAQIRGFIGQEAHHARVHEDFNARARELGMAVDRVQQRLKGRLDMARRRLTPGQQLAVTAALEHVTATLAQWTLENPQATVGDGSDSPLREVLIWHAMEEIEHKAVAFDVYRLAVNDEKQRIAIARMIFRMFWVQMAISQCILLWRDRRLPSLADIREAWAFMWGAGGLRRWARPQMKRYLRRGFHPNDIDQTPLIRQWRDRYPEVAALQVG
ncbi:MAG: metal-dependent hydrolase [Halioglobus sp.]|nr:metal-dependent hydrolase [Halioglobus sp.]